MAMVMTELIRADRRDGGSPADPAAPGDDELLGRFLAGDEATSEEAFGALVVRHGPMVLGVCRRTLGTAQDAEDAFQATFLVLARNAASIRDRRVLGRWLYEVAYRIAIRAKGRLARRRVKEREAAEMAAAIHPSECDPAWLELKPVLHEEVNQLPEKYRSAVVLCYFEGRTNEEAAALLRWPVGTVKGRLSRARDLLRSRLARRGLALSAAFLMTALSGQTVFAEIVPTRLVDQAARTAVAVRRGKADPATVPPHVWDLADTLSPLRGRRAHALKTAVAITAVAAAAFAVGLGALSSRESAASSMPSGFSISAWFSSLYGPSSCH
jgi:RNA polymerase sigma factor (sigma-70 family)